MKLEKQLKADAAVKLDKMVATVKRNADITAQAGGLTGNTLCRIAVGSRVESIRKSAINKIAYKAGEELYKQYTAQSEAKK